MVCNAAPVLEGEILDRGAPDPDSREITPGWITRNRDVILRGRVLVQALAVGAPPPARLLLAAIAVAAEGVVLAADARRGSVDAGAAARRAGTLLLEGATLIAASCLAPASLARQGARLRAARAALNRLAAASAC